MVKDGENMTKKAKAQKLTLELEQLEQVQVLQELQELQAQKQRDEAQKIENEGQ